MIGPVNKVFLRFTYQTVCGAALLFAGAVPGGHAQVPDTTGQPAAVVVDTTGVAAWNSARARALVASARQRRQAPRADSALHSYRAQAEGFVYFYVDRRDSDERTLVKIDQVALDVFWAQPDRTKQRIVGMRDVSRLPNRMYYHLDHLTVVQNDFSDVIRMGDGDEVRDVLHPAGPGAESFYDFRLVDSLTLVLPGAPEPVRVYELQVRPKDLQRPGYVGSIFIDRARGDIVRLTFTFTPASYVDARIDYINVALDNGLWDGRYWLPHEQALELRRQVPELDFIAGAVIRGRMRISDYEFNVPLPEETFVGPAVSIVSREARESYEFGRELYADLNAEGLAPPPEMTELRREAAELLRGRRLSGLPRFRLNVPSVSAVARYNRLEGAFFGGGVSYVPSPSTRLDATAGFGFGAEQPVVRLGAAVTPSQQWSAGAAVYHRQLRDIGFRVGMPGLLNSATALFGANDYTDPYAATGAEITTHVQLGAGLWALRVGARREEHHGPPISGTGAVRPADVSGDQLFSRPLILVDEGILNAAEVALSRTAPEHDGIAWSADLSLEPGTLHDSAYLRVLGQIALVRRSPGRTFDATARLSAGASSRETPPQRQFLLGGRETLPGYPYRSFAGTSFVLSDVEVQRDLFAPWLGVRLHAAAGWSNAPDIDTWHGNDPLFDPAPGGPSFPTPPMRDTDGIRASVGVGLSALWDQLRLDVARGLNSGEWQLLFSVAPDFWSVL